MSQLVSTLPLVTDVERDRPDLVSQSNAPYPEWSIPYWKSKKYLAKTDSESFRVRVPWGIEYQARDVAFYYRSALADAAANAKARPDTSDLRMLHEVEASKPWGEDGPSPVPRRS